MRVIAGHMPSEFSRAAQGFAGLIAAVDQALVCAAAAGSEELQLCRIPERRVEKINAAILPAPLSARHCLPCEPEQLLRVWRVVGGHHAAPCCSGSISTASSSMIL